MPQRRLGFTTPSIGSDLLGGDALAGLFPEVRSVPAALTAWSGSCRRTRIEARAGALGVPFVVFGHGLLRASPRRRCALPVLSVAAVAATGTGAFADTLLADRLLVTRGWELPALLDRAAAARRALAAQRVGGSWWHAGALPRGEGAALVVIEGSPGESVCRAMLAAALAENAAASVVLLAPDPLRPRRLVEDAAARGCAVVTAPVDPWDVVERAARVYAAGGETGFLALLAGPRGPFFRRLLLFRLGSDDR